MYQLAQASLLSPLFATSWLDREQAVEVCFKDISSRKSAQGVYSLFYGI